jgi:hypothetical protein
LFRAFIFPPHDRGKDQYSFLALLHEAPERVPRVKPCHMRCIWLLGCDQHHVSETVAVESANRRKVLRQRLATALVERRDELFDGLICNFLDVF